MIDVFLFDLDGTLIDTYDLIFESFIYTFKKYFPHHQLTKKELLSFCGPTLETTFRKYAKDEEEVKELCLCYRDFNIKNHDSLVRQYPHVQETIMVLAQKYQLGIVSSKKREIVLMGLNFLGIKDCFKCILTSEDVIKHKPDPEIIFKALSYMSNYREVLVVGDNVSDLAAGKRANCLSCGVDWSLKKEELKDFNPDYYLYDINELLSFNK